MKTLAHYYNENGKLIISVLFSKTPVQIFGQEPRINQVASLSFPDIPEFKEEQPFCITKIGTEIIEEGKVHCIFLRRGMSLSS